jgi:NAD(P)-dependent dehydrogenase (short-subunit alcohol dehydrogenase family)
LKNRVVVITGASSGIGRAIATEAAARGAHIVAVARRLGRLQTLASEIEAKGCACLTLAADVTREEEVRTAMQEAVDRFGQIDVLINNAGRGLKKEVINTTLQDWRSVIQTNLTGVFLCSREAVRIMREQPDRGTIVTVSSIAAIYGTPMYSAYSASKHGVEGFMRALKWEVRKDGIRTATVHPGRTDSEFFEIYPRQPSQREMLPASYIAAVAVAAAEGRNEARVALVLRNLAARFRRLAFGV